MQKVDNNYIRQIIYSLNNIPPFNEKMTFFYDESGNCRKFSLTPTGVNDPDALKGDFVLAGVAYEGNTYEIDIDALHKGLNFQKTQKELKSKNFYPKADNFHIFMSSKKATVFLQWLENSGLYIHYYTLNNLYYSLVDIVDALYEIYPNITIIQQDLKNSFYDFVKSNQDSIINLLIQYSYPNIKEPYKFCHALANQINDYNHSDFYLDLLFQMLMNTNNHHKLSLLENNESFTLIVEYYQLYLQRCQVFSNSTHIFDEEKEVQKILANIEMYEDNRIINNYQFVNSIGNNYVQLSDLVAGMLRKLFMFLDSNSMEDITNLSSQLNTKQTKNFSILLKLILRSDQKCPLFIMDANSTKVKSERLEKLKILAR
nr:DUF3800 domain-containing protein [Catenibacterium mitsuokai]